MRAGDMLRGTVRATRWLVPVAVLGVVFFSVVRDSSRFVERLPGFPDPVPAVESAGEATVPPSPPGPPSPSSGSQGPGSGASPGAGGSPSSGSVLGAGSDGATPAASGAPVTATPEQPSGGGEGA
ncbi:MAG: hypothetical protein M3188_05920, partial [Actinomycetota bacterium]|nr:hypothetical protein [Actinomycetota bacterium]